MPTVRRPLPACRTSHDRAAAGRLRSRLRMTSVMGETPRSRDNSTAPFRVRLCLPTFRLSRTEPRALARGPGLGRRGSVRLLRAGPRLTGGDLFDCCLLCRVVSREAAAGL